jgi:ADP-ribosylglycohydrolase
MVSDDTEHTCMMAQSLIVSSGEVSTFTIDLAWRFRFWLLGLRAGIGYATLKAILKLW